MRAIADKGRRIVSEYAWLCIKAVHVQRSLIGRFGCPTVRPEHRLADRDPTIATATPHRARGPRRHRNSAPGSPARTRSHLRPASAFLRAPTPHSVVDSVRRMAPWADSPERSPPPRMWTPPVLHEPGFEAALRLALRWPYKWPYKWPYSGPRAAGVSGVNAGESRGLCRGSGRANQQVRGLVVLAPKGRSGTLTRKRSLVQIQYGPLVLTWPFRLLRSWAT
jgi:hypothetical protein